MGPAQYQDCIKACYACAQACDACSAACLQEDDPRMMAHCIALDIQCAGICRLSAEFMSRDGEFARQLCALCAEVCEACATECAGHPAGHCQACAEACRQCAAACRAMSA
ncbi:MAG: four-helix bundle copper-binding protein [Massilia sp.]